MGYLEGRAWRLWHGDVRFRNYNGRYNDFHRFEFDPDVDLDRNADRVWEWGSDKPELHECSSNYFEGRKR